MMMTIAPVGFASRVITPYPTSRKRAPKQSPAALHFGSGETSDELTLEKLIENLNIQERELNSSVVDFLKKAMPFVNQGTFRVNNHFRNDHERPVEIVTTWTSEAPVQGKSLTVFTSKHLRSADEPVLYSLSLKDPVNNSENTLAVHSPKPLSDSSIFIGSATFNTDTTENYEKNKAFADAFFAHLQEKLPPAEPETA